jgi:hypothetical protein
MSRSEATTALVILAFAGITSWTVDRAAAQEDRVYSYHAATSYWVEFIHENPLAPGSHLDEYALAVSTACPGSEAEAGLFADVATGSVGGYGRGVRGLSCGSDSSLGHVITYFRAPVTLSIPAGTYPDGVEVAIRGHMSGGMSVWGGGADAYYKLRIGFLGDYDEETFAITPPDPPYICDQDFEVVRELVAPGTVLDDPLEISKDVYMYLYIFAQATFVNGGIGALVDFCAGARITEIELTPSGTWVSDTGVLLSVPIVDGDSDWDGDVDLADCLSLFDCLQGPDVPRPPDIQPYHWDRADHDDDGDVDLKDFSGFQRAFTG